MESPYSLAPPGCPVCGSSSILLRCRGCKVVSYCAAEHQSAHRPKHEVACNAIKKSREKYEQEEAALRAQPSDILMPANVFNSSVGQFWGILGTRDYMRARFSFADALLSINSAAAVEQSLGHFADLIRLNSDDKLGVRDMIPSLLLRLGREQECYNFLKWWAVRDSNRSDGNANKDADDESEDEDEDDDLVMLHLDLPRANAFEPVDAILSGEFMLSLSQLVALTLLKLRLYLDLSAFEVEFEDHFDSDAEPDRPVGKLARARARSFDLYGLSEEVEALRGQYRVLCDAVHRANRHFWSLLVDESFKSPTPPALYEPGSIEEAHLALYQCRRAWDESEDAIIMIDADTAAFATPYQGRATGVPANDAGARRTGTLEDGEKRRGTGKAFPSVFNAPSTSRPAQDFPPTRVGGGQTGRFVCRNDPRKMLVYTDGACSNNGQSNPQAGWAVSYGPSCIVSGRLESKGPFGDDSVATSNRAELQAAIAALRISDWRNEGYNIIVIATDSSYVVEGATGWATGWVRNGWRTRQGSSVKNRDLWQLFLGEVEKCSERGLRVELWRIPRELNLDADAAAKAASQERIESGNIGGVSSQVSTATTQQRSRILGLCIEEESLFLACCGGLVSEIASKTEMDRVATPEAALAALNQQPPPTVILVADGGLTRNRKVLERVIDLLRDGATVVLAGVFSSFVNQGEFDRLFATIGLPWKRGGYDRMTQKLHRDAVGGHLASRLPSACSQKALYVKGVERSAVWYTPDDSPDEASAVFAKVGSGRLGYVGDVNGEDSSNKIILAMCGLLD